MSNATMSRRPAGPVRQHSLQQPPRRQQQIRRQRSTEDERNLQIYSTSNSLASSRNNRFSTNNPNKYEHHHHHHHHNHVSTLERPKVRVAWSEHQSQKSKNDGGVEIVARQIPTGKSTSRPATGRANRGRCPLAEKATILYSRQELAERLRLAWRQREENKSNIDIFLAHNTVEERCESRMSSATNRTALSSPKLPVNDEGVEEMRERVEEARKDDKPLAERGEAREMDERKFQTWFTSFESTQVTLLSEDPVDVEHDDQLAKAEENLETPVEDEKNDQDEPVVEKKSSISINCNDWNASITINNKPSDPPIEDSKPPTPSKEASPDFSQARLKRASYQSGLNKAFVGPITPDKPPTPRISSRVNSFQQEPGQSRFRRTSSAPPQRRTQVSIVIDTPSMASFREIGEPAQQTRAMSANGEPTKNPIASNRPIKSAPPVKRRSKGGKKRGLSTGCSKAGGEDDGEEARSKGRGSKGGKNVGTLETRGAADVVTMVSLVSSADSESEMDENSPRDDKLICELRNKLPTTPIIKSSNGLSGGMRKPFKSVSFQQDSFDYDSPPRLDHESTPVTVTTTTSSRTTSLQARFVALSRANVASSPDDTALLTAATMTMSAWSKAEICPVAAPLLQLQPQKGFLQEPPVAQIETPLTDREKRCLAVPIGDIHDKKRKLVRCRSALAAPRLGHRGVPPRLSKGRRLLWMADERSFLPLTLFQRVGEAAVVRYEPDLSPAGNEDVTGGQRTTGEPSFQGHQDAHDANDGDEAGERQGGADGALLPDAQGKGMLAPVQKDVRQGSFRIVRYGLERHANPDGVSIAPKGNEPKLLTVRQIFICF
ncbi:uncharacterized protein LOC103316879 isoform X2 [Nasonia vitripennis]|nr:uncharacterized protein LOC103316879 isoform X2 [Nasonia vitripennis]XP_031785330.1 uncharacterized protein LOC103316879 isoform X2 [Nasonia vitripennis]XP_031785335.1 uncharacterized protein LOC103316879 isoform X2 [Nasonia vitripennis]XP_032456790.1 uncharacterized protein LOC103316879 isoform X2 [Nasonia vitripennis]